MRLISAALFSVIVGASLVSLPLHAACPADDQFKFESIEYKLNLDGNDKTDVVALFSGKLGESHCLRRAVIFDAPATITSVKPEEWFMDSYEPEFTASTIHVEKRPVGDRDLLVVEEEIGNFRSTTYYTAGEGKLRKAISHAHPSSDGQLNEVYDKKSQKLGLRIFDSGEFEVNGAKVDLEQRSLALRCRSRALYVQLKYEWDKKEHKFNEVDQGCVMGSAID